MLNLIIKECLTWKYNEKWHLIIYHLRKMLLIKQNYNIYNKKLLIIMKCLNQWKIYVKKVLKLNIYINHKNLMLFTTIKILN